jgi:D-alanyl-D-alanine carboxypeptidase
LLPPAARRRISALLLLVFVTISPGTQLVAASRGGSSEDTASVGPGQLAVGGTAVVRADGDCLNIREQPGLTARTLTCVPEGTTVQVIEGRRLVDGYNWQKVQSGATIGWAAEVYLAPPGATSPAAPCTESTPPAPAGTPPATVTPSPTATPQSVSSSSERITGEIPLAGGYSLVVWDGGTTEEIATSAAAGGCRLSAVWASSAAGELLVYVYDALDVVNQSWMDEFAGREVPHGTAVLLACGGPAASALTAAPLEEAAPNAPASEAVSGAIDPASWGTVQAPLTAAPASSARTVLVLDGATGNILHEKEGRVAVPPASLTKMVVAILAIEHGNLDAWVKTDVDSRQMPGSSLMGLLPGDCFRLRDLVYGLMLPSGNDAALAIARFVSGSDGAFVEQMNGLMTRLGLVDSHFVNPHGLDAPGHMASAYDLAMVARYGMTLPFFAKVVGTPQWTARGSRVINLPNVNGFLSSYRGADGVKTGYTGAAGRTLVASATRNGARVFVALLNDNYRYEDAARLMDWAFAGGN